MLVVGKKEKKKRKEKTIPSHFLALSHKIDIHLSFVCLFFFFFEHLFHTLSYIHTRKKNEETIYWIVEYKEQLLCIATVAHTGAYSKIVIIVALVIYLVDLVRDISHPEHVGHEK